SAAYSLKGTTMAGNEGREAAPGAGTPPVRIDTSVAHIARVQDYWLGGRDNFVADRHAGDEAAAAFPGLVASVRSARSFLARTVRYLTVQEGVRQFLDIGSGIPTAGSTHEVAQAAAPDALVVYMDNDPVVFAHARGLLASGPHGSTAYLGTDLRDTGTVLTEAARLLDLTQSAALVLMSVLQFIRDEEDPWKIVATLLDALAPGSFLVVAHPANDIEARVMARMAARLNELMAEQVTLRSQAEVERFFRGLRLVPPGIVRVPEWRPDSAETAARVGTMWGGVGQK
ncbi:MAG TPA: SAM-dependent methyltransferase, partial [Streptosporangiaceae bacterium]